MKKVGVKMTKEQAQDSGYATFNGGMHTLIDLSETLEMETVSIKLPSGDFITVCNIPFKHDDGHSGSLDIKYHGEAETKVLGFEGGRGQSITGSLYALDYRKDIK